MDPLSIAVSATALATFAFRASKAIYGGVESVMGADATLLQLQSEVDALQSGLESIASTFQSNEVVQLCTSKSGTESQSTKLLISVKPLLNDCEMTLDKLSLILEGMDKPRMLRKPIKALKISQKSGDIDLIRHQIRSYSSAMQMTLHMVGICLSVDGNKQVETLGDRLGQQLESLAAQITDMQKKVSETNQDLDGDTLVADESDKKNHIQHIEEYIQTAEVILSTGSVYAESVAGTVVGDSADVANLAGTFGSVLGMNDAQRRRINQWLPAEQIPEGSETDQDRDTDDEDDVDKDVFLARLAVAQKRLKAKEFKAAEAQFGVCLSDLAVIKSLPEHEVVDLKLDLATACRGSGNTTRQQSVLNDLLKLDLPKIQEFHLKHTLAVAYLDDFQLDLARSYADYAMKGRKKLLGRRHESYFETLSLLVAICKAQDDNDTADVYQALLPADYQNHAEGPSLTAPSNDIAAIKALSDNGYDINNKKTYFEALDWAVKEEKMPIVRLLLERSTDIKAKNEHGETTLFYACRNGFEDIVARLLDQGADIKARGRYKRGILSDALKHEAIVELLLNRGAELVVIGSYSSSPLAEAATHNYVATVKVLLQRGANVEGDGGSYETPLQSAARAGHIESVRLLLDAGARIDNMTGYPGCTPLMCAALKGHIGVIQLLLERGADPKLKTKGSYSRNALEMAKDEKQSEAVKVLKAARTGMFKSW